MSVSMTCKITPCKGVSKVNFKTQKKKSPTYGDFDFFDPTPT